MNKNISIFFILVFQLVFGQDTIDKTNNFINEFKIELAEKKIKDFFIVKHITYGAMTIQNVNDNDFCEKNQVYFRMYGFWRKNNEYWLKVYDNCGGFVPIKLQNRKPLDFYFEQYENLKTQEIQVYKTKPDSIANGKKYSFRSSQNHSPLRFFWFYSGAENFKKSFDKYDLTTDSKSPNINYEKNEKLSLVELNILCERVIEEYVKKEKLIRTK